MNVERPLERDMEQPMTLPSNRIFAVVDDPARAEAAVAALAPEVPPDGIVVLCGEAGVSRLDAHGTSGSMLHKTIRVLQGLTLEGPHVERYEAELLKGHYVLEIDAPSVEHRDKVVAILEAHGAHFINLYGRWTIETLHS